MSEPCQHSIEVLLLSYNRQCPDCRRAIAVIDEDAALDILAAEVQRCQRPKTKSRIRLANAIAIYQSAAKRAMAKGRGR